MAKDDYFVLVGKILVYLYARLKGRDTREPMQYLQPNTKDFPINEEYFDYIIKHMYDSGFLEGMAILCTPDGDVIDVNITEQIRITPDGIEYLEENSKMQKILKLIPEAASIIGIFK